MKYNPETAKQGDVYSWNDNPDDGAVWVVTKDGSMHCAESHDEEFINECALENHGLNHSIESALDRGSVFLYNCLRPSWED